MSQAEVFSCSLARFCSGCSWFEKSYDEQRSQKIQTFGDLWKSSHLPSLEVQPKFVSISQMGLRDRADLVIDRSSGGLQKIGLYDREHREVVDLVTCPQLSPELQKWFDDFRKIQWPIKRGSVRLRVSPQGKRGVWLDFANVDVKTLLDEKLILQSLMNQAFVEIGQRHKHLVESEQRLKLVDPVFEPWFETYAGEKKIPLQCNVASFTQPGFRANKVLLDEVFSMAKNISAQSVAEFGSGIGNFTLPLAARFTRVDAFELDRLACEALERNLTTASLLDKVTIHQGDFQKLSERRNFDASKFDLVFVDPPRSGLKNFLDPLFATEARPKNFIYVSCFPESFCFDSKRLYELGYTLRALSIVDQFPQTPHAELVAHFII